MPGTSKGTTTTITYATHHTDTSESENEDPKVDANATGGQKEPTTWYMITPNRRNEITTTNRQDTETIANTKTSAAN